MTTRCSRTDSSLMAGSPVRLLSGNWLVYTHNAEGRPVFHRKLEVRDEALSRLTLGDR